MDGVLIKVTWYSSQNLLQAFYSMALSEFRLVPETGTSRFVEYEEIFNHIIEIVALGLILDMFHPKRRGRSFYDEMADFNANCCNK